MSNPTPNGTIGDGPRGREIRITRRFRATPEEVWAALTESDRLERWIGRWEGDPGSGRVTFFTTAEGEHTTLTFAQLVADDDMSSIGPGWEYYLDRLATVVDGGDVRSVRFPDYFPAMKGYYAELANS